MTSLSRLPAPVAAGSRTQDAELDINKHENGKWSLEVLRGLGLVPPAGAEGGKAPPPPLHVGVSFGGAVLLDLAVVAPEAIRGAALVVPGGLLPGEQGWGGGNIFLPEVMPAERALHAVCGNCEPAPLPCH